MSEEGSEMKPIKTKDEYENAIAKIDRLIPADLDTPDGDRLEVLVALVIYYESKHYKIPRPDPLDAIRYRLESRGLTKQVDLCRALKMARGGIEKAITSEDGLDGAEGNDLICLIDRTLNRCGAMSASDTI